MTHAASQVDLSGFISGLNGTFNPDKFRPMHLRYLTFDGSSNNIKLFLDKGDVSYPDKALVADITKTILDYFLVGVSLPADTFWVNLRPDSPDNIIDPLLEQTNVGRIMLESDVQLKKDTAAMTSPQTPEGQEYWNKLYAKAEEIYGTTPAEIPTIVRPWIVPDEIIIRETPGGSSIAPSAYIYKSTLKVMLEDDYIKLQTTELRPRLSDIQRPNLSSLTSQAQDEKQTALNEYAAELMRTLVIPKLTKAVNSARRYAPLRQVYYSLIMAQWFKSRFSGSNNPYSGMIDCKNLSGLASKEPWSKNFYYAEYKSSFNRGEYDISETIYTPSGQAIRRYVSGGIEKIAPRMPDFGNQADVPGGGKIISDPAGENRDLIDKLLRAPISVQEQQDINNYAEKVLGRKISEKELDAIIAAHNAGEGHFLGERKDDGRYEKNTDTDLAYTQADIWRKTRILKDAGFSENERRKLIEFGVAGNEGNIYEYSPEKYIKDVINKHGFDAYSVRQAQFYIANNHSKIEIEKEGRINKEKLSGLITAAKENDCDKDMIRYLEMVLFIKDQMRIEITGLVLPGHIETLKRIIRFFPKQLSNKVRAPIELTLEDLPDTIAGQAFNYTHGGVQINRNGFGQDLEHTIWHELMHKFSLSSGQNRQPLVPVHVWKRIAKAAGFYGALINGRLVKIDALPNDYKEFREIGYGQWIYQEEDGSLSCYYSSGNAKYVADMDFGPYERNAIKVRYIQDISEYWKTTPKETVAELGAAYIKDSRQTAGFSGRKKSAMDLIRVCLFAAEGEEGEPKIYGFDYARDSTILAGLTEKDRLLTEELKSGPHISEEDENTITDEDENEFRDYVSAGIISEEGGRYWVSSPELKESTLHIKMRSFRSAKEALIAAKQVLIPNRSKEKVNAAIFYASIGGNEEAASKEIELKDYAFIAAGDFLYRVWVEAGKANFQRYRDPRATIGSIHRFEIGQAFRVGSNPNNDYILPGDINLSPNHFNIKVTNEADNSFKIVVNDVGSREGTCVIWGYGMPDVKPMPSGKAMSGTDMLSRQLQSGEKVENEFVGNLWIKAGSFWYKAWVEGENVSFQRHSNERTPLGRRYSFQFGAEFAVGRSAYYRINDPDLANQHFSVKILRAGMRLKFIVTDTGSKNGTYVEWNVPVNDKNAMTATGPEINDVHKGSGPNPHPFSEESQGDSNLQQGKHDKPGGIDFRSLPIVTQCIGSLKAAMSVQPISGLEYIDLQEEFKDIKGLVDSGITPSAQRISDYVRASCLKDNLAEEAPQIIVCISDILRMQEENASPTEPILRDIVIVLDSSRSPEDLKHVFFPVQS